MKVIMPLVLILLWSLPARQALPAEDGAGAAPWYTVELLLFTRSTSPGAGGEVWPRAAGNLDWDSAKRGHTIPAPGESRQLTGTRLALSRAGGEFTPVIHAAWRQPVLGRRSARSVYLRSEREIAPGTPLVEGLVRVSVSRFLHLNLDLLLRGTPVDGAALPGEFQTFRFDQHRRMRSGELHYIDHPLMGMLIVVTPVDPAGADAPQDDPAADD